MSLVFKSLLAWLVLLVIMFANGVVRVAVWQPRLGEAAARQLASIFGILIVIAAAALFVRVLDRPRTGELLGVGALWVALTLAFEFGFGRFVLGASWDALLADYDVLRGRLWVFVLATTLVAPAACGAWRARHVEKSPSVRAGG